MLNRMRILFCPLAVISDNIKQLQVCLTHCWHLRKDKKNKTFTKKTPKTTTSKSGGDNKWSVQYDILFIKPFKNTLLEKKKNSFIWKWHIKYLHKVVQSMWSGPEIKLCHSLSQQMFTLVVRRVHVATCAVVTCSAPEQPRLGWASEWAWRQTCFEAREHEGRLFLGWSWGNH